MSYGLLLGEDAAVASWAFAKHGYVPTKFDLAVGVVNEFGHIQGAALFQGHNGPNVELSYYGRRTLSPGIARALARVAQSMGVARVTVMTSKKNRRLIRSLERMGFVRETVCRRYYGAEDTERNAAARLVLFRERLDQIARREV